MPPFWVPSCSGRLLTLPVEAVVVPGACCALDVDRSRAMKVALNSATLSPSANSNRDPPGGLERITSAPSCGPCQRLGRRTSPGSGRRWGRSSRWNLPRASPRGRRRNCPEPRPSPALAAPRGRRFSGGSGPASAAAGSIARWPFLDRTHHPRRWWGACTPTGRARGRQASGGAGRGDAAAFGCSFAGGRSEFSRELTPGVRDSRFVGSCGNFLEDLAQTGTAAIQPGQHGAARRAHHLRGFFAGQALQLDQHDGGPEGLRELGERAAELVAVELAQHLLLWVGHLAGDQGELVEVVVVHGSPGHPLALAVVTAEHVVGDLEQPCAAVGPALERGERAKGAQVGLLGEVLGRRRVTRDPQVRAVDDVVVRERRLLEAVTERTHGHDDHLFVGTYFGRVGAWCFG